MRILSNIFQTIFGKTRDGLKVNQWELQLKWIEHHESDFGVRMLDCRSLAQSDIIIKDLNITKIFYGSRKNSGENFRDKVPLNSIKVKSSLKYPKIILKNGPLFKAEKPEVKWDIYHFQNKLYFVRSWSNELIFQTDLIIDNSIMKITEINASPEMLGRNPAIAIEQVNCLIETHLMNHICPVPIPLDFPKKPREIALYAITCYGSFASYATYESITKSAG